MRIPKKLGIWRNAHENRKLKKISVGEQNSNGLPVSVEYELTGISVPYTVEYLFQNDGSIKVTATMNMQGRNLPELPRFGMRTWLNGNYKN